MVALAARVSKYGITFDEAMWHMPLAVLNQFLVWDELANGRKPRWATSSESAVSEIDALIADAMTGAL
jgi:hypothetical protein